MCAKIMYGCVLKGMRETLGKTLVEIGKENEKVIVIDCETGPSTNILEFRDTFPARFISMGIAEQNAISFAFGVVKTGYIPIIPLFSSFMTRKACDQIFIQVGYANENIKMIGCYSGITTPNTGATHQSINDVSIMRSIPNILIIETADEFELKQALKKTVEYKGPVYLRMIRGDISPYNQRVIPEGYEFEIGKASILKEGNGISLIGSGLMVSRCMEAAEKLKEKGIDAEVINCSTIKPLDKDTILKSVKKTKRIVTAENHTVIGGMGSAIAEMLIEEYPVPLKMVGIKDKFGESAELKDLLIKYGLTSDEVVKASLEIVNKK